MSHLNIMTALALALALAFLILWIWQTQTPTQTGGGQYFLNSTIKDYDITEKVAGKEIVPTVIYTYRYLAKYYTKLLNEWLMDLEKDYLGGITPKLKSFSPNSGKVKVVNLNLTSNDPKTRKINQILDYLRMRLNENKAIMKVKDYYYIKGDLAMIPINKNPQYTVKCYYQKDLNSDSNDTTFILVKFGGGHVKSMGIQGLPKIKGLPGISPARAEINGPATTEDSRLGIAEGDTRKYMKKLLYDHLDYKLSRCFLPKDKTASLSSKNAPTEEECVLNGGVWDHPCYNDNDCPYYRKNKNYPNNYGKCNTSTGYCQLPDGLVHKSYRKAEDPSSAICYNCKGKGSISGTCCSKQKDPDYKFAGDSTLRLKYRSLLRSKGLNWFEY